VRTTIEVPLRFYDQEGDSEIVPLRFSFDEGDDYADIQVGTRGRVLSASAEALVDLRNVIDRILDGA
jgi:hypothetical protein